MKIARFFAPDMRRALHKVRVEQGPDAVILSSTSVDGGVEVIAAIDCDEALLRRVSGQLDASAAGESDTPGAAADAGAVAPAADDLDDALAPDHVELSARNHVELSAPNHVELSARNHVELSAPNQDDLSGEPPRAEPPEAVGPAPIAGDVAPAAEPDQSTPPPRARERRPRVASVEWTQDPTLVRMRDELSALKTMMTDQLSGLAWNDLARREPHRAAALRNLTRMGIDSALVEEIVTTLPEDTDPDKTWRTALALLARQIPLHGGELLAEGGVYAIVGPTGVGKTTTLAKLAARHAMRDGRDSIGLVTTDDYRIGAQEQLFTFGKILGVPVHVAGGKEELRQVLGSLADRKLVLVDTAGISPRDERLSEQFATLEGAGADVQVILALAANTERSSLAESIRVFGALPLVGTVVTKLDEATSLGAVLSAVIAEKLPICYVANGQRVPEDIRVAGNFRAGLISYAVKLMKRFGEPTDDGVMADRFGHLEQAAHA